MKPQSPQAGSPRRGLMVSGMIATALLLASAVGLTAANRSLGAQLRKLPIEPETGLKFHTLPEKVTGWRMVKDDVLSAEAAAELGTQNYVSRWYEQVDAAGAPTGVALQLHCAYYTGMIDTVPHVPERCMIGGGMETSGETRVVPVPLDRSRLTTDPDFTDAAGKPLLMARNERVNSRVRLPAAVDKLELTVTPFRDAAANTKLFAGYFFIANGGVVASANDVRLLAFNLQADYAYYAKIQFMSASVKTHEQLAELAAKFLDEAFPDIMQRVPDWVNVEQGLYPADNPRRAKTSAGAGGSSSGGSPGAPSTSSAPR